MLRRTFLILATSIVLLNQPSYVFAHDHDEWNPSSAGPLTTWTAPLCGKGKFAVQPFFFYNKTRGTFDNGGNYNPLPDGDQKYQFQGQMFVQYGLTDRLEIAGQMIYQQNYVKKGNLNAKSHGLGDSILFLRYCAVEEEGALPHLTALFQLKAPTGNYQHANPDKLGTDLMGGGSWDHGYGVILTKKMEPYLLHLDAIYNFPTEIQVDGIKTLYGEYLNYDLGIEYFLPGGFNLMLEANGFLQGNKKQDGADIPGSGNKYLTIAPGLGWSNEIIQTLIAYQRTLSGRNTDANNSIVFDFVCTF